MAFLVKDDSKVVKEKYLVCYVHIWCGQFFAVDFSITLLLWDVFL